MKKSVVSIMLMLAMTVPGFAKTDREMDNLKGKVKFRSFATRTGGGEELNLVHVDYHENGMAKKRVQYKRDGVTIVFRKEYVYAADGSQTETVFDGNGKMLKKFVNSYDGKSRLILSLMYSPDGHLHSKTVYEYDLQGNVASVSGFGAEGRLLGKSVVVYDKSGKIVGQNMFDAAGMQTASVVTKYSDGDSIVEQIVSGRDYPDGKRIVTYADGAGRTVRIETYTGTALLNKKECLRFDRYGNVLEEIEYDYADLSGNAGNRIPYVTKRSFSYQYYD